MSEIIQLPNATTAHGKRLRSQSSTGEQVMREGARILAKHFKRRLPAIPLSDPLRSEIEMQAALMEQAGR